MMDYEIRSIRIVNVRIYPRMLESADCRAPSLIAAIPPHAAIRTRDRTVTMILTMAEATHE
jgi:hypothetical protein